MLRYGQVKQQHSRCFWSCWLSGVEIWRAVTNKPFQLDTAFYEWMLIALHWQYINLVIFCCTHMLWLLFKFFTVLRLNFFILSSSPRFVECTYCGRKQHQICSLHMEQIWPNAFVCAACAGANNMKRRDNKYTAKRKQLSYSQLPLLFLIPASAHPTPIPATF